MECCNLRYIGKNPIDLRTDEVTTVNQEQNIVVKDVAINGNVKDLVKDRGIFNSKSLTGTDYNTLTKQGVYAVPLSGSTNGPGYAAKVLVYSVFGSQMVTQVAIDVGSVAIKCRYKSDTADWTPWETVIFNTDTATTTKAGIVQLNDTVTSTSTTQAATANAVKIAYDKAVEASESTGRSETADKLTTARTIQTNLASTASASFDGTKNVTPGVTGVLPVANGGTGRTDGKAVGLATARTIGIGGIVTGTATSFNGAANITIDTTALNLEDTGIVGELPITHGGTGRTDGKAPSLVTARTIGITGVVTGTATAFDGTKNITIDTTTLNLEDSGVTGELPTSHGGTGRTDGKAVGLVTKRTIDGVYFDGTANITHFGSCSTAAATAAKVVSVPNFVLDTGAEVTVRFTVTNTAASPTLNVNNTGAKAIVYRNAAISAGYLAANHVYKFVYDGTNYELIGDVNTDTNTDTKVTQTVTTTDAEYPLLVSTDANKTSSSTTTARFASGATLNPSTKKITCSGISGINATSSWVSAAKVGGSLTEFDGIGSGKFQPFIRCKSTNGVFLLDGYQDYITFSYLTDENIANSTNTVTESLQFNESGLLTSSGGFKGSLSGNASSATKLASKRTIDGVSFDGSANITHFGKCSTEAGTAAKVVSVANFVLATGAEVTVQFTVTNTAASPTLNVNNTGAKAIVYRNAAISAGYLAANRVYKFVYDGTNYELIGDIDTNTKYTAASATPKAPGTAAVGTSAKYAREDHVHPLQTTVSGNAGSATKLATARTIGITGAVTGTATSFDGTKNISIDVTKLNLEDSGVTGELPISHGGTGRTDGKAAALVTARTISLTGAVTGSTTFDGSKNVSISTNIGSIGGAVPIGGIIAFSGTFGGTGNRYPIPLGSTTPDTNWCLCDGTTTSGKAVPDLRGRMILGASTSHAAGTKGGSETHTHSISGTVGATTLTISQMPSHTHSYTRYSSKGGEGRSWEQWYADSTQNTGATGGTQSHTHTLSGEKSTSASSFPPYYALAFIIRVA